MLDRLKQPAERPVTPLRRPAPKWGALATALAATLVAVVGLGFGYTQLREVRDLRARLGQATDQVAAITGQMAAVTARLTEREATLQEIFKPGVELFQLTADGDPDPGIQLYWDRERHRAIVNGFRLKPVPPGQAYQLWFIKDGAPVPSVTFKPSESGEVRLERIDVPARRRRERRGRHGGTRVRLGAAHLADPAGRSPQALVTGSAFPAAALLALAAFVSPLPAQGAPTAIEQERAAFIQWLTTADNSPLAVVALQPIGAGVTLGPEGADVPLAGLPRHRVTEGSGGVSLEGPGGTRPLATGRPVRIGAYTITPAGLPGRRVVTIHGSERKKKSAEYYPYDRRMVFEGPMAPPEQPGRLKVLALDGIETEAIEAGTVTIRVAGRPVRLKVRRIPTGEEESELEIFFRDATNDAGTYPAGRFVTLEPIGEDRYRLDLQPGPESVLRLQLGLSLPGAVARQHDRGEGRSRREVPGRRVERPAWTGTER